MEKRENRAYPWVFTVLGIALIASLIWGYYGRKEARAVENDLGNQYNRAFHELTGYVDNIEVYLYKAQLSSDPAQLATISGDIFREAAAAKSCLGQLPTSQIQLENTAKFLSQVGDYTYVLSQTMINGGKISEEDYNNLASLTEYAVSLNDTLQKTEERLYNGEISFLTDKDENGGNVVQAAEGDILQDLENVEKSFDEYPSLIYDGPFSEHIENMESYMIKNSPEISSEDALKKAKEFLGSRADSLKVTGETQNSAIDSYTLCSDSNDSHEVCMNITKKGGYMLYFLDNRNVDSENLDINSAIAAAKAYLGSHGFDSMISSYYEKANNVATINFAYVQEDVTCYSDLIKVKVALDNGEIVGMETKGYLMNHRGRSLGEAKLTMDEARAKINSHLNVTGVKKALVPKDSLQEVLCYEFHGTFNDRNFIVYMNVENGREENILLLIESEDGILTI